MTLREAINEATDSVMDAIFYRFKLTDDRKAPLDALALLLAAARALACERCGGSGLSAGTIVGQRYLCDVSCPKCRDDREKASGR